MMRTAWARPKVNLFLHVTGKRSDGYHLLESLVCFTGGGDKLTLSPGETVNLLENGPYASQTGCQSRNLVMRAADLLQKEYAVTKGARILLEKNLPVASGIGGGSADAAVTLQLLNAEWDLGLSADDLARLGLRLGADLPICLAGTSSLMRGIGENIEPVASLPEFAILLVNPGHSISTPAVFKALTLSDDHGPVPNFSGMSLLDFFEALSQCRNDLQAPALKLEPAIAQVLSAVDQTRGCHLSRMSGSGATCFGLYATLAEAEHAKEAIQSSYPNWWAQASLITDRG